MGKSANRGKGRGIALIREHMHDADGPCLIWPMHRDWQGYGCFGHEGKMLRASRCMCEQVNGPPPTPEHHAAHSCGRGHDGCYHPTHLFWKTPTENQMDSVAHGTVRKPGTPRQKLSDAQVQEIRTLEAGGMKQYQIATQYGVRRESIGQILRGAWRKGAKPHLNQLFDPVVRSKLAAQAKEQRAAGMTYAEIGAQFGASGTTARRLVRM